MKSYDVVIVGAGPAGLTTAHELSSTTNLSILILEKGKETKDRFCSLEISGRCLNCEPCNVANGIGGAGLFSDGKLCLSNDVGERLKDITNKFAPSVVEKLDKLLKDRGTIKAKQSREIRKIEKLSRTLDMNFECYDVRGMGSHNARLLVSELEKTISKGNAYVSPNSNVVRLKQSSDGRWIVQFKKEDSCRAVSCRFLVVAVGRSGAKWFLDQAKLLDIKTEPKPFYLGLRIETTKEVMNPLTRLSHNPKLSWGRKGKQYIKTHCFCEGGVVITYSYDNTKLVGGLSDSQKNTSFSLLVEHHTPLNLTTYEYSHYLCRLFNQIGKRKIMLQKLGDFKRSRPSSKSSITRNIIQPTLKEVSMTDISSIFQKESVAPILGFIKSMNTICPGLDQESTLLYAPALEWCVDRFLVTANMETQKRNLYAIGDGSGTTQGIVASAATGLIAAKDIAMKVQ